MIHSDDKARLVWVNRMTQGFQAIAGISNDKFVQLDQSFGLVDLLFDRYETSHEVAGSYSIEAMYRHIPDTSGLVPYSEERCIETGVNPQSLESRLAFLMNFEIADAILDIAKSTGWDLLQTTKRVYATETYRKWMDIPTDYCKYAYPVKITAMCEELQIPSIYS